MEDYNRQVSYIQNPSSLVGQTVRYIAEFAGFDTHTPMMYSFVGEQATITQYSWKNDVLYVHCCAHRMWLVSPNIETTNVHRTQWEDFEIGDVCASTFCAEWHGGFFYRFRPRVYGINVPAYTTWNPLCAASKKKIWNVEILDIIVHNEEANDVVMWCESEYGRILVPYTELHIVSKNISYNTQRKLIYEFNEWKTRTKI